MFEEDLFPLLAGLKLDRPQHSQWVVGLDAVNPPADCFFTVASLLRGDNYAKLLTEVADQAELEGTPLLAAVEEELCRQRGLAR